MINERLNKEVWMIKLLKIYLLANFNEAIFSAFSFKQAVGVDTSFSLCQSHISWLGPIPP